MFVIRVSICSIEADIICNSKDEESAKKLFMKKSKKLSDDFLPETYQEAEKQFRYPFEILSSDVMLILD